MSLWEIVVTQKDCPHILTSKRFRQLYITVMGTEIIGKYQKILSVFSFSNSQQVDQALRFIQNIDTVKDFELLSRESRVATALYRIPQTSMFKSVSQGGLRIHPMVIHNGFERWHIVTSEIKSTLYSRINDEFTRIISIRKKKPTDVFKLVYNQARYLIPTFGLVNRLSKDEIELVKIALQSGFFSWPRSSNLTSLSKKLGIPKSTLSYRLRIIDKNIAEALI